MVYRLYGVEASAFGIAWGLLTRQGAYRQAAARNLGGWNITHMDGRFTRMPASFVIGPDQRVALAYYGRDSGDFLPFSELDTFMRARARRRPQPPTPWRTVPPVTG